MTMAASLPLQEKALKKEMFAGIVTSLTFHNDTILLAGHGPYLKVYNIQTGELLASESILPANRIHRIVPVAHFTTEENGVEKRKFAVFGSKYLSFIQLEVSERKASITIENAYGPFKDWIMDAQWICENNETLPTQMAIVFAHNNLAIYDFQSDTTAPELLYSVQCEVKCILYSARIFGTKRSSLIVSSGTVFNEVHLWKPFGEKTEQDDAIVYKKLIGHEGVIFGMRFNTDASQIVSVSDDRTIRVWPLNDDSDDKQHQPIVLFGHTARIWDCQFVDEYLVSISEDSTCRVWKNTLSIARKENEEDADVEGDCIACWEGHASRNVWSCAVNPEHTIVATGGQDSGIRLWSLTSIKNHKIDSEDDLVAFPLSKERGKDYIRNFVLIKNRWIVAMTTYGYLLKCDTTSLPHKWVEIQYEDSYKNYAIMKGSECGRIVVVGNLHGDLVIISLTETFKPFKINAHKQKIFEICIEPSVDENILYIISNGYNDSVLFHRLVFSEPETTVQTLFNLEMPKERTTVLSAGFTEKENILICGSRESALLIYRLPPFTSSPKDTIQHLKPDLQFRRTHNKQAITSVLIKKKQDYTPDAIEDENDNDQNSESIIFWTTGRDGCYIQYRLSILDNATNITEEPYLGVANRGDTVLTGQGMVLEKLYQNRVTKGTLEGSLLLDGELLLQGFFGKSFFVYNEKKNFVVVSIKCGGGHRRWRFSTQDAKLNMSEFAFIRKEVLYAYFRDTSSINEGFKDSVLQKNYHGREVRALRYLPLLSKGHGANEPMLFATGGEDTTLRIQQYMPHQKNNYKCHTHVSIRKHTTVIKNIDCSQGISSLLFTSGGLEELRCWEIEASAPKIPGGLVSLNCLEVAACHTLSQDIETRVMDTTVFAIDPKQGLHIIGAVYSDAMIRFWLFNEVSRKFCLVADGTWHAKCILQIAHVVLEDYVYFLTSATDGRIAVWDISQRLHEAVKYCQTLEEEPTKAAFKLTEPAFYYSAHMSGVNALDAVPFKDNRHILVATGGEDNAVSAAVLLVEATDIKPVGRPFIIPDGHASSVTGIKIIQDDIFTISTDQRLNKWKTNDLKEEGVLLTMSDAEYMDVPDPSALDAVVLDGNVHVAITGIGLQSVICPL